jgi:hypothetical protein
VSRGSNERCSIRGTALLPQLDTVLEAARVLDSSHMRHAALIVAAQGIDSPGEADAVLRFTERATVRALFAMLQGNGGKW